MKKLISLLLVAVLALSLVACGDPETAVSRFVGTWEGESILSAKTQDVDKSAMEEFLKAEDAKVDAMIAAAAAVNAGETTTVPTPDTDATEPTGEETEATEATGEEAEATEAAGEDAEATEAAGEDAEATEAAGEDAEATEATGEEAEATEPTVDDGPDEDQVRVTISVEADYHLVMMDDLTGILTVKTHYNRKIGDAETVTLKETEDHYSLKWVITKDNTEGITITEVTNTDTGVVVAKTIEKEIKQKGKDKNKEPEYETVYPLRGSLGLQVRESDSFEFDSTADLTLNVFDNNAEDKFTTTFFVIKLSRETK